MFVTMSCLALAISSPLIAQQSSDQPIVNKAAAAKFGNVPNVPECVTIAPERGDPGKGPAVFLSKFSSGCAVPWHWHSPNEHIMGVSGTLQLQMKGEQPVTLHGGDFAFAPSHHIHRAKCVSAAPCVGFLYSDGAFDIHYVDAAGQEIPPEQALKVGPKAAEGLRSK